MARLIRLEGLLRFQDSNREAQAEQHNGSAESVGRIAPKPRHDFPPFQRVKLGAGDMFLAAEAMPELHAVN